MYICVIPYAFTAYSRVCVCALILSRCTACQAYFAAPSGTQYFALLRAKLNVTAES